MTLEGVIAIQNCRLTWTPHDDVIVRSLSSPDGSLEREHRRKSGGKKGGREEGRTLDCHARKNSQLAYHICSLILLPSSSIVLILKSRPAWRDGEVNNSVVGKLSIGILSLIQGNYILSMQICGSNTLANFQIPVVRVPSYSTRSTWSPHKVRGACLLNHLCKGGEKWLIECHSKCKFPS